MNFSISFNCLIDSPILRLCGNFLLPSRLKPTGGFEIGLAA
jgi:hypothetical protein